MAERPHVGRVLAIVITSVTLIFVPKIWLASTPLYARVLTDGVLGIVAAILKLTALGSGAVFAARSALSLDSDNPARGPWRALSGFLASFFLGQVLLSGYSLVFGAPPPIPSFGDAFFLIGYALFIAAAVRFVRVYIGSGFPLGPRLGHLYIALGATAVFIAVGVPVLIPVYEAPGTFGEHAINLGYPILDFIALVPVVVLLRIATYFRGGRVFRVWATLVVGMVFASLGDVLFAYWTSVGETVLGPMVDAMLIASYAALAGGAAFQYELLREGERTIAE